jgi:NADPH2:quinone reductase
MRAVQVTTLGSLDGAAVVETVDPVPAPGEVLVEVHAAPVNYVDLITVRGEYQFRPAVPYTPGKGPAGVVRALGADVDGGLAIGDRVLAMAEYGGYAELVAVDQRQVYRLPEKLSFVDAASMSLAFDTAWMALRERGRLAEGETVLVLGATGAVGQAAVQLANAMGARRVFAGISSAARFPEAVAAGADAMVDLSLPDLRESVRRQVFAANEGSGVDVVIDMLGGDAFDGALRALAWRGRLVVVGFAAGRIPTLKANYPMLKNIEVSGLQISDYRKRMPDLLATCYCEVFSWYEEGRITAPPSKALGLAQWREAWNLVAGRSGGRRVVLLPAASPV